MPSCITHQLISERARELLPEPVKEAAERRHDYYFLGAQGPDVFFFYKPLSKKEFNFGRYLHRNRVYDVFRYFAAALNGSDGTERERLKAYAAGYLCHYCADTAFHPYVYRYLEEHGCKKSVHQLIESDWDVFFARMAGKEAAGWRFPFSAKKINTEKTLFRLFEGLAETLGRLRAHEKAFARGVSLYERYLKFFHGKSRAKFFRCAETLFGADHVCSALYPRKETDPAYLYGEEFKRLSGAASADDLFKQAVNETAELSSIFFRAAEEDLPLPRERFSLSFLSALPVP